MIELVAAEEMFRNALAWVCLRGAGVVFCRAEAGAAQEGL